MGCSSGYWVFSEFAIRLNRFDFLLGICKYSSRNYLHIQWGCASWLDWLGLICMIFLAAISRWWRTSPAHVTFWLPSRCSWSGCLFSWLFSWLFLTFCLLSACFKQDPTPGLLGQAAPATEMCSERQQLFYHRPQVRSSTASSAFTE